MRISNISFALQALMIRFNQNGEKYEWRTGRKAFLKIRIYLNIFFKRNNKYRKNMNGERTSKPIIKIK